MLKEVTNRPLVSVIVRTVNRPFYLKECLLSICAQEYNNIEIILVNDGGPSVEQLIADWKITLPCKLIELDYNHGRSASGNIGIKSSIGDYICFIDDDDIFYPDHLCVLVDCLSNSKYKVAYTDALEATQILCPFDNRVYMTTSLRLAYTQDFSLSALLEANYIPILCPLFSAECLQDGALEFDYMLDVLEDWDFWIQLGLRNEFKHIPLITAEYRLRLDGSNTVGQLQGRWNWSREYIKNKYNNKLTIDSVEERQAISAGR